MVYGIVTGMRIEAQRKITVHVPSRLLEKAQESTGEGVTATVRRGLQMIAGRKSYEEILALKGKVKFSIDLSGLREDRE